MTNQQNLTHDPLQREEPVAEREKREQRKALNMLCSPLSGRFLTEGTRKCGARLRGGGSPPSGGLFIWTSLLLLQTNCPKVEPPSPPHVSLRLCVFYTRGHMTGREPHKTACRLTARLRHMTVTESSYMQNTEMPFRMVQK